MKKQNITILHQEEDFVVVVKPAGYLSIPDRFNEKRPCMSKWLENHLNQQVFTVHRLDFNTSGLMIFALNAETHKYFNTLFQKNKINKNYLAIVEGKPDQERSIDISIRESNTHKGKMETHVDGKKAFTSFKKLEQFKDVALLDVSIKTGRTHQIRIHLCAIGHPILADELYGSTKVITLKQLKPKFNGEANPLIRRTALQAHTISFIHPKTEALVSYEAPLPKDFAVCLKLLRKWGKI